MRDKYLCGGKVKVTPEQIAELVKMVMDKTISFNAAESVIRMVHKHNVAIG